MQINSTFKVKVKSVGNTQTLHGVLLLRRLTAQAVQKMITGCGIRMELSINEAWWSCEAV